MDALRGPRVTLAQGIVVKMSCEMRSACWAAVSQTNTHVALEAK